MNIQIRGTTASLPTKANGSGNDLVGTIDGAVVGGELHIFGAAQQVNGATWTTPSGWSLALRQGQTGASTPTTGGLYYRQAVAGDAGTTVTLHSSGTQAMVGVLAALYDADGGTLNAVLDGTPDKTQTNTDATSFDSPAGTVTTAGSNSLIITVTAVGKTGTTTVTPPGDAPTVTEIGDNHLSGATVEVASWVQASPGAISARTFSTGGLFDSIVIIEAAFTYTPPGGGSSIPVILYAANLIGG